ncbi:MAG: hypothetical protein IJD78_04215 [Clostridia bacterium]|nr:hypothetical protein [Clostridia bacterium]
MFIMDGIEYDVDVGIRIDELERSFEKLSTDKSGRTQNGKMYINLIGVFYNYKMTVRRGSGCSLEDYEKFFEALSAPVPFNVITVPFGQTTLTFEAYITKASQQLIRSARNKHYWGPLSISFVSREPQRVPTAGTEVAYL